jgi:hypothetical protein
MTGARWVWRLAGVGIALALAACSTTTANAPAKTQSPSSASPSASAPSSTPSASATTAGGLPPGLDASDPYVHLAAELHRRGVQVWFETDLVKRWLEGPDAFAQAVDRVGALARLPGVEGLKIADELGYGDGLGTPGRARQFLTDTESAVHRLAPSTKLLVDAIVPELGCLPWRGADEQACAESARRDYPAATEEAMTSYLRTGAIDVLDLSTGLLDDSTYRGWGLTLAEAQQDAWAHVAGSDWPGLTTLQARKALAEPGGYQGNDAQAIADAGLYVDIPLAAGASAVDIWTWRQPYEGATVSLLPPDLAPNPLWRQLRERKAAGADLLTHMTPSEMPTNKAGFGRECDTAAEVFTGVFVAAGTG